MAFYLEPLNFEVKRKPRELNNDLWLVAPEYLAHQALTEAQLSALKRIADALLMVTVNDKVFAQGVKMDEKTESNTTLESGTVAKSETKIKDKKKTEAQRIVVQFEFQHSNEKGLANRMPVYLGLAKDKYPNNKVAQIVIYTDDARATYSATLEEITTLSKPLFIDLTTMNPDKILKHPDFHIQLLCIFNRFIPDAVKLEFLYERLVWLYKIKGSKVFNFYLYLIICGTTKKNTKVMKALKDKLANSTEITEYLSYNPFYIDWVKKGRNEGREEGRVKTRLEDAILLMKNTGMTAEQAMNALSFTVIERKALIAHLNGRGSNGKAKAARIQENNLKMKN